MGYSKDRGDTLNVVNTPFAGCLHERTGGHPFFLQELLRRSGTELEGRDVLELMQRAAGGDLADCFARLDASGADAELAALARRCLAANAEERPRDGGEVAAAVEAYLAGVQERLKKAELERARAEVKSAEERKRRRLAVGLAAAVLLLLVSGVVAAWLMDRQRARHQKRLRHGGGRARVNLDDALTLAEPEGTGRTDLIALDDALHKLEQLDPRKAKVVSLRYFAGLSVDETAAAMDLSPATVKNDWAFSRAWLHRKLSGE